MRLPLGTLHMMIWLRGRLSLGVSQLSPRHIIILGGGVIGICAAYYLARRGERVTVIDRGAFDTAASTGNAGIIALGHPPMPRPGLVGQTLKMLLDPANPLYVPPRLDLDLIRWMWDFRKACTESHFRHSMKILAELGWATGACFDQLVEEENLDCEYHRTGWLDVFATQRRFDQGVSEAQLLQSYGYNVDILTGDELRRREPAFTAHVLGAAHYTDSRFANPQQFLAELADRAARRGATLRMRSEVKLILMSNRTFTGIELDTGERISGDLLVLAGGAWTTRLARSIGVNVPMQPGKGYHINLTKPTPCVSTTCVLAETFVAVTPIGGGLRLAGTVEFSGINHRMVQQRLDRLRAGARQYLHDIDGQHETSTWCGLRPCTADGLPVIGWAPNSSNVFVATGHAMMGFALAPVTGRMLSECIIDGRPEPEPLSPRRYVRKRSVQEGVSRHTAPA